MLFLFLYSISQKAIIFAYENDIISINLNEIYRYIAIKTSQPIKTIQSAFIYSFNNLNTKKLYTNYENIFDIEFSIEFFNISTLINDFIDISNAGKEKYEILIKCLGICMVTKIASETCKDCGENSIASKIDLAGKAVVLTFSMPLFQEVIFIIKDLLEL